MAAVPGGDATQTSGAVRDARRHVQGRVLTKRGTPALRKRGRQTQ